MENDEKISINLDSIENAYSRFSTDEDKTLDVELVEHVMDRADDVHIKADLNIIVNLKREHTYEEKETFKKVFSNHFSRRVKEEKKNISKKYIISSVMLIIGILLAFIFRIIPDKFFMFEFVTEIGAWVFVWEAVYVYAFNIPFSRTKNIYYKKLSKAHIEFEEQFPKTIKNNKKNTM